MSRKTLKPEFREVRFRCSCRDLPDRFFVVTPHNPDGEFAGDEANRIADVRLRFELSSLKWRYFLVTGGNHDHSHAEPGYGIACSRDEAENLAKRFCQDGIFEVRDGDVILISCLPDPEPDEKIGLWKNLLMD